MDIKGSKTEKNLYRTFSGECRARTKYTLYAEEAEKEGYNWIADVFEETANNELAHARRVAKDFLGRVMTTEANLLDSIIAETEEAEELYKKYEREARKEGFTEIADFFKELQEVEQAHSDRFTKLYNRVKKGNLYKGKENAQWICTNCGYIHTGAEAPKNCPLCKYEIGYFKPYCKKTNS